jgi:hypothetical protein
MPLVVVRFCVKPESVAYCSVYEARPEPPVSTDAVVSGKLIYELDTTTGVTSTGALGAIVSAAASVVTSCAVLCGPSRPAESIVDTVNEYCVDAVSPVLLVAAAAGESTSAAFRYTR